MSSVGQGSQAHSALANSRTSTVQPHRDNDDEHRGPVCRLECSTSQNTTAYQSTTDTVQRGTPFATREKRQHRERSAWAAPSVVRFTVPTVTISGTTWVLCGSTLLRYRGSRLHEEQSVILRKGDLRILTVTRSGKGSRTCKAPRNCACVRPN